MKRKENKKASKTKTFDDAAFNCKYILRFIFHSACSSPHLLFSAVCSVEICINFDFAFEITQKESENKN